VNLFHHLGLRWTSELLQILQFPRARSCSSGFGVRVANVVIKNGTVCCRTTKQLFTSGVFRLIKITTIKTATTRQQKTTTMIHQAARYAVVRPTAMAVLGRHLPQSQQRRTLMFTKIPGVQQLIDIDKRKVRKI
jgi:hypothetical protein